MPIRCCGRPPPALEPGPRLLLWHGCWAGSFAWVFAAIVLLLAERLLRWCSRCIGGFRGIGLYIQLMMGLGIVMMLLFLHLYFAPWRRFRAGAGRQDWAEGGRQLAQIRTLVTINLVLGLVVVAIGGSGRYWG